MPELQPSRSLYLRWRPQTFAEVVDQEHVTRTLRNAVRLGRLVHAYLLCGPRGTGKTSLARILYRAANCSEPLDGEPCGRCPTCTAGLAGRALDLVEVDAASNRGIDDIRQLRERVFYAPAEGRFRVYIIDEAHELSTPAWDAFLKTLEEPPAHAIFVLATTEPHKVPLTIVSRCQRFDLRRISLAAIRGHLALVAEREGMLVEAEVLDWIARMARGGLRDALGLLEQLHAYAGQRIDLSAARAMLGLVSTDVVRQFLEVLEAGEATGALERLGALADEGADLRQFVGEVVTHLRGLLVAQSGAASALGGEFSDDDLGWLRDHASRWPAGRLLALTRSLAEGMARLRDPLQLEMHLELAVLECCLGTASAQAAVSPMPQNISAPAPIRAHPPEAAGPTLPEGTALGVSPSPPPGSPPPLEGPSLGEQALSRVAGEAAPSVPSDASAPRDSQPSALAGSTLPMTVEQIGARWAELMDLLRSRNVMVAAMMEAAELAGLDSEELRLAFSFPFHYRQMSDPRNRQVVEEALAEVFGQPLRVTCIYQPPEAAPLGAEAFAAEVERLMAEDPLVRRAVELWGRHLTIIE